MDRGIPHLDAAEPMGPTQPGGELQGEKSHDHLLPIPNPSLTANTNPASSPGLGSGWFFPAALLGRSQMLLEPSRCCWWDIPPTPSSRKPPPDNVIWIVIGLSVDENCNYPNLPTLGVSKKFRAMQWPGWWEQGWGASAPQAQIRA